MLLHDNLSVNADGHLTLAGVDTVKMAEKYGTPLYLLDEDRVRQNCRTYITAMREYFGGTSAPLLASKALSFKGIYRIAREEGMRTDLVSIGEMMTLHFRVKDDAPDGKYIIDLEYTRDQDVTYLADNKIRTKNLLIDSAEITLSGSKITNVDTIPDDSAQKSQADDQSILWFVAAIFGTVMISGSCILIPMWLKRKKAKK